MNFFSFLFSIINNVTAIFNFNLTEKTVACNVQIQLNQNTVCIFQLPVQKFFKANNATSKASPEQIKLSTTALLVLTSNEFTKFCFMMLALLAVLTLIYGEATAEPKNGKIFGITFPIGYNTNLEKTFQGIYLPFLLPLDNEGIRIFSFVVKKECSIDDAYFTYYCHRQMVSRIMLMVWIPIQLKLLIVSINNIDGVFLLLSTTIHPYIITFIYFVIIISVGWGSKKLFIGYQKTLLFLIN